MTALTARPFKDFCLQVLHTNVTKIALLVLLLQMLQRAATLAAESLKVLEGQLTDGGQTQDVRVSGESPSGSPPPFPPSAS